MDYLRRSCGPRGGGRQPHARTRAVAGGGEVDEESLEALFAEARLVADAAQEALDARDFAPEALPALVGAGARPASQDGWTPVADRFVADDGEQMRLL